MNAPAAINPARRMVALVLACAAVPAWLWFVRDLWPHISVLATGEDFRTNQLLFLGIAALLLYRTRGQSVRLPATPALHLPATLLFAIGAGGYILFKRVLDVNTPAALFAGLALYALVGAWLPAQRWLRGLPAALLLIGALPLGDFADVFIGYPLRAFTAALVSSAFTAAGIAGIRADTILVFENGIAHVDVPCSGVKSLWTGGLFLLAATWLEQRAVSLRWVLAAIAFALVLILMNVMRVALLSLTGQVLGLPVFAEMLHVPLGVVAFAASCAVGWWLLQRVPRYSHAANGAVGENSLSPPLRVRSDSGGRREGELGAGQSPLLIAICTSCIVLAVAWPPVPRPAAAGVATTSLTLPTGLTREPLDLRPGELNWLLNDGAERVERMRFAWGATRGTLLMVRSSNWRAHHRPERCFENYGLRTVAEMPVLLGDGAPARAVTLQSADGKQYSALYWFQSATQRTDDYGARLWQAFSPKREPWVLTTVLFEGTPNVQGSEMRALSAALEGLSRQMLD